MPKPKANSLILLPFRKRNPLGTYHHKRYGPGYYQADKGNYLFRYYPSLDLYERIPVKPVTLSDMGLTRTSSGRIIKGEVK